MTDTTPWEYHEGDVIEGLPGQAIEEPLLHHKPKMTPQTPGYHQSQRFAAAEQYDSARSDIGDRILSYAGEYMSIPVVTDFIADGLRDTVGDEFLVNTSGNGLVAWTVGSSTAAVFGGWAVAVVGLTATSAAVTTGAISGAGDYVSSLAIANLINGDANNPTLEGTLGAAAAGAMFGGGTYVGGRAIGKGIERLKNATSENIRPVSGTGAIYRDGGGGFIDIDHTGISIRKLSSENILITDQGIDVVEKHLSRFTNPASGKPFGSNIAMINDLRRIAIGELNATKIHRDFYAHELREFVRFRKLGFESGMPTNNVYRNAHYATLQEYGIPFENHADYLLTAFAQSMLFR